MVIPSHSSVLSPSSNSSSGPKCEVCKCPLSSEVQELLEFHEKHASKYSGLDFKAITVLLFPIFLYCSLDWFDLFSAEKKKSHLVSRATLLVTFILLLYRYISPAAEIRQHHLLLKKIVSNRKTIEGEQIRSARDVAPTYYILNIPSYSSFSKNSIERYESNVFESGGYKWKLSFYPNGTKDGKNHISLYLEIVGTEFLPSDWEVNALTSFSLYNHNTKKHVSVEVDGDRVGRFHASRKEWGYSKFIPLATFKDPSKGYLENDSCTIGAEIYVCTINSTSFGKYVDECFLMVETPSTYSYTWKIDKFSQLGDTIIYSEWFSVGSMKCKIQLNPNGQGDCQNKFMSGFLHFSNSTFDSCEDRVCARFKLRARDQLSGQHRELTCGMAWFRNTGWGWSDFLELSIMNDPSKGFLVNDRVIMEAEVTVLGNMSGLKCLV